METINVESVAEKYNSRDVIWDKNDKWHTYTRDQIYSFVQEVIPIVGIKKQTRILNAGSAGYSYNISEKNILHVDIAERKIAGMPNSMIGDIHRLALENKSFEIILCVGSVLNYCDAIVVLNEFSRLIADNGYLILEFENSHTFELIGKSTFNKRAVLIDSFYNGNKEKLWFFAEFSILEILGLSGFTKLKHRRFHIVSPMIYRISKSENLSAWFSKLDTLFSKIPFLKTFSSNTILLLQKNR